MPFLLLLRRHPCKCFLSHFTTTTTTHPVTTAFHSATATLLMPLVFCLRRLEACVVLVPCRATANAKFLFLHLLLRRYRKQSFTATQPHSFQGEINKSIIINAAKGRNDCYLVSCALARGGILSISLRKEEKGARRCWLWH